MKQITQIGATVEEAVSLALQQLGLNLEQVDVEVLQEGKKGFLGFGARPAEVRLTAKQEEAVKETATTVEVTEQPTVVEQAVAPETEEVAEVTEAEQVVSEQQVEPQTVQEQVKADPIAEVTSYLTSIAQGMGITDLTIHTSTHGKNTTFKLESEKAALLIGKRGQTLNAIQHLAQLVYNKCSQSFMNVKLDVENYRERRQEALEVLAERMASKAIRTGSKVVLEPMPSYERKVIHNALSQRLDIETYSEGTEPNRYLVIEPLK